MAEGTTQSRTPATLIPGVYPTFGSRGRGARIWDVDGNRYVDWILCFGTIVLGHSHPVVNAAAVTEIEEGFALPLTRPVQTDLAETLVELIPCAEQVLFMKAGSEATSAAVRLARLATGRDKIVRLGYHGWHDWSCTRDAGIPTVVRDLTLTFTYNDLDSLRAVLEAHRDQVACVIMWPCEIETPDPGFLEGVKELAHRARRAVHPGRDPHRVPSGARRRAAALRRRPRPGHLRQGAGERLHAVGGGRPRRLHAARARVVVLLHLQHQLDRSGGGAGDDRGAAAHRRGSATFGGSAAGSWRGSTAWLKRMG